MNEILTIPIPFSWPNSALTIAMGNVADKGQLNPIEWQRSLARRSLQDGGKVLDLLFPDAPVVLDYKKIQDAPAFTCSLAHTGGPNKNLSTAVGASLIAANFMAQGVGIDLEWAARPMGEGTYRRFAHKGDHASWGQSEQLLWTWMVKEACFKAASNAWGDSITLINQVKLPHAFCADGSTEVYHASGDMMGAVVYRLLQYHLQGHALRIVVALA